LKTVLTIALVAAALGLFAWKGLPATLQALGLHPHYSGPAYRLDGRRALIVTTSHAVLGDTGKPTGVFGSELTVPYYAFADGGMQVDVASIRGGEIPIEPDSFRWFLATPADRRFLADPVFQQKTKRSLAIDDVDFAKYDVVFLAGGWGAAYDLGQSASLGRRISDAWAAQRVVGGVCHGPLGLLQAVDTTGQPLVKGKRLTAVTDLQVKQLGIEITPMHPERELRAAGALFEGATAFRDVFANHVVVDGRLVTGQNQNAGAETAQSMMRIAGGAPAEAKAR
jgi:putative intracellular protease/amidase